MPLIAWKTGVYCWTNRINRKRYVGGAYKSFVTRFRAHTSALRRGDHFNRYLQHAWNRYGSGAFTLSILERCPPWKVKDREQYWMDYYQSANSRFGYNLSPTAGSTLGTKLPSLVGNKHGTALKGRRHTADRRAVQSVAMLGNRNGCNNTGPKSEEHKAKISRFYKELAAVGGGIGAATKGRPKSLEQRAKISASLTGKKQSDETKIKRAASLRGRKRTPEQRLRMSEAALANRENRVRAALEGWLIRRRG